MNFDSTGSPVNGVEPTGAQELNKFLDNPNEGGYVPPELQTQPEPEFGLKDAWAVYNAVSAGWRDVVAYLIQNRLKGRYIRLAGDSANWLRYSGGVWERDPEKHWAKESISYLENRIENTVSVFQNEIDSDNLSQKETEKAIKRIENLNKFSGRLKSREAAGTIDELASQGTEIVFRFEKFDTDGHLINLKNGVLDLQTGNLYPHSPEYLHTLQAGAELNPKAQCPKFDKFLHTVFRGNSDVIESFWQFAGLCLSGRTDLLQGFVYAYGHGANGKSTLFKVLALVLGDYCATLKVSAILQKNDGGTGENYELAKIKGRRLLLFSEVPARAKLNEGLLKDLTGGDKISVRPIYQESFEFVPVSKIVVIGNHKLRIEGTDEGIWRRVKFFEFSHAFERSEQRPQAEVMGEFETELSGILNRALGGFMAAQKAGRWYEAAAVTEATNDYRKESDAFGEWFSDCVEITDDLADKISVGSLFKHYSEWCNEAGHRNQFTRANEFTGRLKSLGLQFSKPKNINTVHEIRLSQCTEDPNLG